jgi:putative protease
MVVSVLSQLPLQEARNAPMTAERLREHLGRFGDSPYQLNGLEVSLEGPVLLPISELNRMRRALVTHLDVSRQVSRREKSGSWKQFLETNFPAQGGCEGGVELSVLCRDSAQLDAALSCGIERILLDFEDVRRYRESVEKIRALGAKTRVWLATPRIQKAGEEGFFRLIENAAPDGVLIRNLGAIDFFVSSGSKLELHGDFSLNVANPLTAKEFLRRGLGRLTLSYDLTLEQVVELVTSLPPQARGALEITIHQHMPMFHMEHCVFAAFLSSGKSFLDCGRPCEKHRVHLRDRVGVMHPLRADVGCRNTLYNAVPQTGAQFYDALVNSGLRSFRVELLEEDFQETERILRAYQALCSGERGGGVLWREFRAQSQLGVTRGTLATRPDPARG